jgi:N-acetylmuramoyl-L-alanine amidase
MANPPIPVPFPEAVKVQAESTPVELAKVETVVIPERLEIPVGESPALLVPEINPAAVESGDWLDLEFALRERGWSGLTPVSRGKESRHESTGPGGVLSVVVGQKKMWWNGTQVWLGFEPRMERGRVRVNRLDLESHVQPLVSGGAMVSVLARTVVIDAGHGGRNPGSRSIAGNRFEKEFTLDWALRLQRVLEGRGWKVWMTRTNDIDLSLAERVDIAEAAGAAIFISLHFNSAFPSRDPSGLETYSVTPLGMASHVVRDYPDDPRKGYPANAHDAASLRMAVAVQRSVLASTGQVDRGVRRARFMDVLRWQNRPAILVEGGYLSNPQEASKIQTAEFRQKLAEAVAAGLP